MKQILLKLILCSILLVSIVGCNDSDGGGYYEVYNDVTGLSKDNKATLTFSDYSLKGTYDTLPFSPVKSGDNSLKFLSKKEIKDAMTETDWQRYKIDKPDIGAGYMFKQPTYFSPFNVGEPKLDVLNIGLERVNLIRRLAGLNKVVLDEGLYKQAQCGAWLMAREKKQDHALINKVNTVFMPKEFKDLCASGTMYANIYYRPAPGRAVDTYMGENGNPNLGHRLYILSRIVTKIGLGVGVGNNYSGFNSMRFNMAKQNDGVAILEDRGTNWDITAWPTPGYFPHNTTWFEVNGNRHWHFAMNDRYQFAKDTEIIITEHTGESGPAEKTWTRKVSNFVKDDKGQGSKYQFAEYSDKANIRIIDPRTCIFTLDTEYAPDKLYKVEIRDIQVRHTEDGELKDKFSDASQKKTLQYGVLFFDLNSVQ